MDTCPSPVRALTAEDMPAAPDGTNDEPPPPPPAWKPPPPPPPKPPPPPPPLLSPPPANPTPPPPPPPEVKRVFTPLAPFPPGVLPAPPTPLVVWPDPAVPVPVPPLPAVVGLPLPPSPAPPPPPTPFAPPWPPSALIVTKQAPVGTVAAEAVNPGVEDENNVVGAATAGPATPGTKNVNQTRGRPAPYATRGQRQAADHTHELAYPPHLETSASPEGRRTLPTARFAVRFRRRLVDRPDAHVGRTTETMRRVVLATDDAAEGRAAAAERRPPRWQRVDRRPLNPSPVRSRPQGRACTTTRNGSGVHGSPFSGISRGATTSAWAKPAAQQSATTP